MIIILKPSEIDALMLTKREDRSKGGFQSLMVKLQDQLDGTMLRLEREDIERVRRYYAYNRHNGGYQGRLNKIFGRRGLERLS